MFIAASKLCGEEKCHSNDERFSVDERCGRWPVGKSNIQSVRNVYLMSGLVEISEFHKENYFLIFYQLLYTNFPFPCKVDLTQ